MKKFVVMSLAVLAVVGFAAAGCFAAEPVKVNNKFCPISGEKIGQGDMKGTATTIEYKGKIYNLCCPMCKKAFLKDPEAAIKKMEEQEAKGK